MEILIKFVHYSYLLLLILHGLQLFIYKIFKHKKEFMKF
jgi:hypothetical protein